MKKILAILSFMLLLVSCTKKETNNEYNPLIDNMDYMANFLFDIHLTEALERERLISYPTGKIVYKKLFEQHGITPEQFDSAVMYYTVRNNDYKKLYEKVTNKINKYIEFSDKNFFNRYPKENINIWKDYAIFPEGFYKTTQFLPYYICPKPEYLNKPLIINQ